MTNVVGYTSLNSVRVCQVRQVVLIDEFSWTIKSRRSFSGNWHFNCGLPESSRSNNLEDWDYQYLDQIL